MTETLTESFCERCGTRYEFSAPTRLNPLRKTRGLIGGLKNWVTSQDDLSDSINDAMREEAGVLATAQLSAFHEAFNFCIDCRQYTCLNCWNENAGRCRSCIPVPGQDDFADRFAEVDVAEIGRRVGAEAWPTHDLPLEAAPATNGHVDDDAWATTPGTWATAAPPAAAPGAETPVAPGGGFVGVDGFVYETQEQADAVAAQLEHQRQAEAAAAAEAEAEAALAALGAAEAEAAARALESEPVVAEAPEPEPVVSEAPAPEPVVAAAPEPEPVVAELEPQQQPSLRVVGWDEDAAEGLEPEPIVAEAEPEEVAAESEAEPVVAAEPPTGPDAPVWPDTVPEEPAAAATAAEQEAPAGPRIAPISETILHMPQRPAAPEPQQPQPQQPLAAQDESPEAAARREQLDMLGLGDPGEGPIQPERQVIPYRSRGAAVTPVELALRAAAGQRFWEASAREVASAVGNVGVQNCGECGLSLSANARFCRRCGTRQAQSA